MAVKIGSLDGTSSRLLFFWAAEFGGRLGSVGEKPQRRLGGRHRMPLEASGDHQGALLGPGVDPGSLRGS
jgi:hypothetical protein